MIPVIAVKIVPATHTGKPIGKKEPTSGGDGSRASGSVIPRQAATGNPDDAGQVAVLLDVDKAC